MRLRNKTILLTGASGGIGKALSEQLALHGARLVLVGRDANALNMLAAGLQAHEDQHCVLSLDLETHQGLEELVAFCQNLPGSIDIIINTIRAYGLRLPPAV